MEKEKVIELAKRSNNDEREKHVTRVGAQFAGTVQVLFILLIVLLRDNKGINFSQDLLLLMMAQLLTLSLYRYIKLKNPYYLISSFIALAAVLLTLFNVLIEYGYIQ